MGLISAALEVLADAFDSVGSGTDPGPGTTAGGAAGSSATNGGAAKKPAPTVGELADQFEDAVDEVMDTLGESKDVLTNENPTEDEKIVQDVMGDTVDEDFALGVVDEAVQIVKNRKVLGPAGPLLDSVDYVKTGTEGYRNIKKYNARRRQAADTALSPETRGEVQGSDE